MCDLEGEELHPAQFSALKKTQNESSTPAGSVFSPQTLQPVPSSLSPVLHGAGFSLLTKVSPDALVLPELQLAQ